MKLWAAIAVAITASTGMASGQEQADPRAIAFCDTIVATVPVAECLPDAHVAVKVFDAFDELYPAAAQPVRVQCGERNENPNSSALCVIVAIETAIAQAEGLPAGAHLDDPALAAISDPALFAQLQVIQKDARTLFPDRQFWGGGMYLPYE